MNEGRDVGEGGNMEELLGVGQAEKDGIWGLVATTGKPHCLITNCRNPRNCPITSSHILPTSSTTFKEAQ